MSTQTSPAPTETPVDRLRRRGRVRGGLPLLGPAFVAAIAYVDPGNFATNFSAGSRFGYLLVWVIVAANLMAMLVQSLSAKLGLATGHNLAELCRMNSRVSVTTGMWVQGELVAMATDLAEVIGGAVALNLLFRLPLVWGGVITGGVAFALLGLQRRGYRQFEVAVAGLLGVILLGFLVQLARVHVSAGAAIAGLTPRFYGNDSVVLATGILGATVMPHAVYLHSALTQRRVAARSPADRRHLQRHHTIDIVLAMGVAGAVNLAMVVVAAAVLSGGAHTDETLSGIHAALAGSLGSAAGVAFALALLASGFASSGVGTLAGQVIMQGFVRRSIPLAVRRLVTLLPALVVLGSGLDPTRALVLSQVVLSFGLPFALVPLVRLTSRADLMGDLVNRRTTTMVASLAVALIVGMNGLLVVQTVSG